MGVLRTGTSMEKCEAAASLARLGPAAVAAVPVLIEALEDPASHVDRDCDTDSYYYVREEAVRALAQIAPSFAARRVIPVMVELLDQIRQIVPGYFDVVGRITYVRFFPEIIRCFGQEAVDAMVEAYRSRAQDAVEWVKSPTRNSEFYAKMKVEAYLKAAEELLGPSHPLWVKEIREAAEVTHKEQVQWVLAKMRSSNTKEWAIEAIRSLDVPTLLPLINDNDTEVADVAAGALVHIGKYDDGAVVSGLLVVFPQCQAAARKRVIGILSQIYIPDGIVKTIIGLALSGWECDCLLAVAARLQEGKSDANLVRLLSPSLRHPDTVVRKACLLALYQLGNSATDASSEVRELLARETDPVVLRMAANTLTQISR